MKRSSSRVSVALVSTFALCVFAPLILQAWQARPPRDDLARQALFNGPNPIVAYKSDKQARQAENQWSCG